MNPRIKLIKLHKALRCISIIYLPKSLNINITYLLRNIDYKFDDEYTLIIKIVDGSIINQLLM